MYLRNGRAAIIDLSTGEVGERELTEDALLGETSSLELSSSLSVENDGALVLGSGLLTGSLIPAACAGMIFSPDENGKGTISPIMGLAGVELKLSGFDFIVIKGESPEAGYLWVRDGIAEFVQLPDMIEMDSWARTDKIRVDQGDRRIQVIASGPFGDGKHISSRLVTNHWLGEDEVGLASAFGKRRLCAVAFRGMGELEVADPEAHFASSVNLQKDHVMKLGMSEGLASYFGGSDVDHFKEIRHRVIGCFGCPHPCRSYAKVNEDPGKMSMGTSEPGYLHYDIPSLKTAFDAGIDSMDATRIMMACSKAGVDSISVISALGKDAIGTDAAQLVSKASLFGAIDRSNLQGSFVRAVSDSESYSRCVSLGLCPRYWGKVGLDMSSASLSIESAIGKLL